MQPPTQLGKYTIIERIGQGAYGVVYRARDEALDRDVALKVLHPFLMVEPGVLERFWREARAMAQLHHPGIVTIHDVGQEQGLIFLVERYVPGPTLEDVLQQGPLPLDRTVVLTEQLATALDYAHGRGFLHRDVKPANVILDAETDQAVLTDFGLARALESSGSSLGTVGTPAYIPPEVWENEPPDARSDVYALAVVVYEMLVGRTPFDQDTPAAAMRAHLTQEPPFPPDLAAVFPPPVRDVLRQGLAKRREDRYPSAGALAQALHAAITPLPTRERGRGEGESGEEAPPPPARRWPLWTAGVGAMLGLAALVLCLAVFVGGGMATCVQPTRPPTSTPLSPTATPSPLPPTVTPTPQPPDTPGPTALPTTITGQDGKTMVLVPAGPFLMGSTDADPDAADDEQPQHEVVLDAFYIDQTEVTNAEFCRFLNDKGNQEEGGVTWLELDSDYCLIERSGGQFVPKSGYADHPVIEVSWYGARAYARWAGKRLPTEAEWEKAARGTDGRIYP